MNISTIHFQQGFVEFKIYISLKRYFMQCDDDYGFVEFKIYISLKPSYNEWRANYVL